MWVPKIILAATCLVGAMSAVHATSRELVVPFAPGGAADNFGRLLAQELSAENKETVVVVNRPGAGGSIGAASVARANPDGKTIFLGTISTHAINPSLYKDVNYDPVNDFVPLAKVLALPNVLVVSSKSDIESVDDLVERAKSNDFSFGSPGNGTTSHLAAELMKQIRPDMRITHVPYKGTAPAITDLLGGHLDLQFDNISTLLPQIKAGKLRALAVSSNEPSELLPDVKPLSQQGFDGFEITSWFGLWLPKGASQETVDTLNKQLSALYAKPEFIQKLKNAGITPSYVPGAAFVDFVSAEQGRWADVVKKANIQIQ